MPSSKSADPSTPAWLSSTPIAHRGLHSQSPAAAENSMTAFRLALEADLAIEFDVHLSADHIPVVFHDDTLARMTGDKRHVSDVSAEELGTLSLDSQADTIPRFADVLSFVAGKVPLVIELKQCPFGNDLLAAKVWDILKDYDGPYSVQSFDPRTLKWFRENAPHVIRGQLAANRIPRKMPLHKKFMVRHMLLNHLSRPHYIGYDVRDINRWTVRRAVKKNMHLLAWTVSSESELGQARQHADNIIFEKLPLDHIR